MNRPMHFLRRFARNESGVAAIEMAFTFPIIVWLTMGILELGVIFHISSLANFAANEAARLGKTGSSYSYAGSREQLTYDTINRYLGPWMINDTELSVSQRSYGSLNRMGFSTSGAGSAGVGGSGEIVMYTVTMQWQFMTPLFATLSRQPSLPITARVLTKNENF